MSTDVLGRTAITVGFTVGGNLLIPGGGGAFIGAVAGAALSSYLFPLDTNDAQKPEVQLPGANPGAPLPIPFGTVHIPKVEVDFSDPDPTYKKIKADSPGPSFGSSSTVGYKVFLTFGCTVCEGPATILKIWRNGILIYDNVMGRTTDLTGDIRLYDGSADQLPDPAEQEIFGINDTSSYPGVTRFVLEDHNITDGFPIFQVLVARQVTTTAFYERIDDVVPSGLGQHTGDPTFSVDTLDGTIRFGHDRSTFYGIDLLSRTKRMERDYLGNPNDTLGTANPFDAQDTWFSDQNAQANVNSGVLSSDERYYYAWGKDDGGGAGSDDGNPVKINVANGNLEAIRADMGFNAFLGADGACVGKVSFGPHGNDQTLDKIVWVDGDARYTITEPANLLDANPSAGYPITITFASAQIGGCMVSWISDDDPLQGLCTHIMISAANPSEINFTTFSYVNPFISYQDTFTIGNFESPTGPGNGVVKAAFVRELNEICGVAILDFTIDKKIFFAYDVTDRTFRARGEDDTTGTAWSVNRSMMPWSNSYSGRVTDGFGRQYTVGLTQPTLYLWDWNTLSGEEVCNLRDTTGQSLNSTEGGVFDPNNGAMLIHAGQEEAITEPEQGWTWVWCEGVLGQSTNLCAITQIVAQYCNYDDITTDLDCTDVSDEIVEGALADRPMKGRDFLEALYRAHHCLLFDGQDYRTIGRHRGNGSSLDSPSPTNDFNIALEELGAYEWNGTPPDRLLQRIDERRNTLPRRVSYTFQDMNKDYSQNEIGYDRSPEMVTSVEEIQETYPGAMTRTQAKEFAKRRLKSIHKTSTRFTTETLPVHWLLEPGDIGTVERADGERTYTVEISQANLQENGIVELQMADWDDAIVTNLNIAAQIAEGLVERQVALAATVEVDVIDGPLLVDTHDQLTPIRYIAATTRSGTINQPVIVEASTDGGVTWVEVGVIDPSRLIPKGLLISNFSANDTLSGPTLIDRDTTITVNLAGHTPSSAASEAAWLADEDLNVMIVEADDGAWEYIRFRDVTNVVEGSGGTTTSSQFQFSTLLRGQRNTWNHQEHTAGVNVYFPFSTNLTIGSFPVSDIGTERLYRARVIGNDPIGNIAHTPSGRSRWSYNPVDLTGSKDGNGTWSGTFRRRSKYRAIAPLNSPPLDDTPLNFEIDITDIKFDGNNEIEGSPGPATVLFTITTTASANGSVITTSTAADGLQSWTFNQNDVETVLGSPATDISGFWCVAYQLNTDGTRGEPRSFFVGL